MYKYKLLLFTLVTSCFFQFTHSQNNTNSPYTRFGYGNISETFSGEQKALGGTAFGARSSSSINTVNPASYSSVDSLRFMFDVGSSLLYSRFSDVKGTSQKLNGNIEYITLQFPLSRRLAVSAGLLPYSSSGYNLSTEHSIISANKDTVNYSKNYSGKGGFNQVYLGLSTQFFNHISLGVNAYYMYGTIDNYRNLNFGGKIGYTSTTQSNTIDASNFRFRYGAQFFNTFAKKHDLTIGLIYEQKKGLNGTFTQINSTTTTDTISQLGQNAFELPTVFGGGLNYTFDKKFTLAVDYSLYKWSETKFFNKTDSLNNSSRLAIGIEYQPRFNSKKFTERIKYRAGFNMSDTYYKLEGANNAKNIGASIGFGIPIYSRITNTTSTLNTTFEYGKVGGSANLKENYFKFTVNMVFNENWFQKIKL